MLEQDAAISPLRRWLETLTITMLSPWLGFWASHTDPFMIRADFPWLVFVPLLIGTQHGMWPAVASAALLGARAYAHALQVGMLSETAYWVLGCLLVGAIAGYYRDRAFDSREALLQRALQLRDRLDSAPTVRHVVEAWPARASSAPAEPAPTVMQVAVDVAPTVQDTKSGAPAGATLAVEDPGPTSQPSPTPISDAPNSDHPLIDLRVADLGTVTAIGLNRRRSERRARVRRT